jgi:hypothetical protein
VTSVPSHSWGTGFETPNYALVRLELEQLEFHLALELAGGERNSTFMLPPRFESPDVSRVHQPATPSVVESAA